MGAAQKAYANAIAAVAGVPPSAVWPIASSEPALPDRRRHRAAEAAAAMRGGVAGGAGRRAGAGGVNCTGQEYGVVAPGESVSIETWIGGVSAHIYTCMYIDRYFGRLRVDLDVDQRGEGRKCTHLYLHLV
jgi:hypothetical protein